MSVANELPPDLESALRAELRGGERIAFAAVPLTRFDSGELAGMLEKRLAPIGLAAASVGFVLSAILLLAGEVELRDGLSALGVLAGLSLIMFTRFIDGRERRRKAARSTYAITDQRVILLSTWPERSVLSIEAREITEIFCWIVSPKCGHVRFAGGAASTEANALMFVPNPRACEVAMVALRDSSRSAAGLRTKA